MTIKFLIVANSLPNDAKVPVYVRLVNSRYYDKKVKTNLVVRQNLWDSKKEVVKYKALYDEKLRKKINDEITNIRNYILKKFNLEECPTNLPSSWLSDCINNYYINKGGNKTNSVANNETQTPKVDEYDFFKLYEKFQERQEISESRSRQYKVLKCTLERYQLYVSSTSSYDSNYKIKLHNIDSDFLSDFYSYVENEHIYYSKFPEVFSCTHKKVAPKPRSKNTMTDLFKKFRAFLNWCFVQEYISTKPFSKFKLESETYGTPFYLTLDELKLVHETNFKDEPILNIQKDIFVFQCCVGCRVGDLMNLKKTDLINGNIEYIPNKTIKEIGKTVVVPLNNMAKGIVEKYFNILNSELLPFSSPQKYNEDIKKILEKCEITRLVSVLDPLSRREKKVPINTIATSHMARRTFIGNIYKNVKNPNLVASLTGHTEGSKAFSRYRDIDNEMKKELVGLLE